MLWNQYKYIAFNIFSCNVLIISYKMLTITEISSDANKLPIYAVLCRNVTIFYRQELLLYTGKIENVQELKVKLFELLLTDCSHTKIIWLHVVVFKEHDLLQFLKVPKDFERYPSIQISKFLFVLDK